MAQTATLDPSSPLQWYGYVHVNGSIHVKRYADHRDITEAQESDFVDYVVGPFNASSREDALIFMRDG